MNYSWKCIPIPSHREYTKSLIEKVESVIKRMRWRAVHFLNRDSDDETTDTSEDEESNTDTYYGFKSKKAPPQVPDMIDFEMDLLNMVENIEFRQVKSDFQAKLKEDLNKINSSNKMFVEADKTRNMYQVDTQTYNKLMADNITKNYKAANIKTVDEIESEFNNIADELNIGDRINPTERKHAFISLKDHKENFGKNHQCRLINPTKSELGRVSKQFLDRINESIRNKSNVKQWRNTNAVIEWFEKLPNKNRLTFLVFDIIEFYPSISEDLLKTCLEWAKKFTHISDIEYRTILHCRRSLLFDSNDKAWTKKDTNTDFDVTMGSNDGAEIAELVGLYILYLLESKLHIKDIGLYRDDGLAAINARGRTADKIRKELTKIMQSLGLKVTVQCNLKEVNYLDIHLDLSSGLHMPYRKPNDNPLYVHAESNHPPTILQHIPQSVSKRISTLSSNENVFKDAAPTYDDALKSSGYKEKISYQKTPTRQHNRKNRSRKRHVTWFNPPYSKDVKTNVGGHFLKLISRHFPRGHSLNKIFNANTIKVSYSCLPNMRSRIKTHNARKIQKTKQANPEKSCNCRKKDECPLRGNCMIKTVVYKATVRSNNTEKAYIGQTGGQFKTRFRNHKKSFNSEKYANETELSKYIWELKKKKQSYQLTWEVIKQSNTSIRESGSCNLCLDEKIELINCKNSLNKKTELISTCRHRKR